MALGAIRVEAPGLRKALEQAKVSRGKMKTVQKSVAVQSAYATERAIKLELTGKSLNVDTGQLRNSYRTVVQGNRATVGSSVVYSWIHERGGTIRPKTARALTVPLSQRARDHRATELNLFVWRNPSNGKVFLARMEGDRLAVLYLLTMSVDIPASRYLSKATRRVSPEIEKIIDQAVEEVTGGA